MGREAVATCHWRGQIAEARLHLDAQHLSLRGDIRADLPRSTLCDIHVTDEGLRLCAADEPLVMEFGAKDALAWQKALLKAPPTLAEKLGLAPKSPAFVTGDTSDEALATALTGNTTTTAGTATLLIAVTHTHDEVQAAIALAQSHRDKHLWFICRKGKTDVGSTFIRTSARAAGLIDSKSCAVSDVLTATRYRMRTG